MSSKSSSINSSKVPDLWTILERNGEDTQVVEDISDTTVLFVGDSQCGKTTLIQGFLKPTASKEPKATFALEYSFARRKHPTNPNAPKSVSHIWELGGDIYEPSLLDVPLSLRNLNSASVVICIDLSKAQNSFASLTRWIELIREVINRKVKELQSKPNSSILNSLRDAAGLPYQEHADKNRVDPCIVPLYVVGTKYDMFKNLGLAERRAILQALRFCAHAHGATLLCSSALESGLREAVRGLISSVCFRSGVRSGCEFLPEKPFYISAGRDSFESILIGGRAAEQAGGKVLALVVMSC